MENVSSCMRSTLVLMLSSGIAKLCEVDESWITKWYVPGAIVVTPLPAHGLVKQSSMSPVVPSPETKPWRVVCALAPAGAARAAAASRTACGLRTYRTTRVAADRIAEGTSGFAPNLYS